MEMRLPNQRPSGKGPNRESSLKAFIRDPKQASDEALRRRISERLLDLVSTMFVRLEVAVDDGEVTLKGTVASKYEHGVVLRCVREIEGVQEIHDFIRQGLPGMPPPRVVRLDWRFALTAVVAGMIAIVVLQRRSGMQEVQSLPVLPVKVQVQVEGRPASGVFLTLHPLHAPAETTHRPQGRVGRDGKVEWTTFARGDGVPAGEYAVTAVWYRSVEAGSERRPGKNVLLPEYTQLSSTRLRLMVRSETPPLHFHLQLAETPKPMRR